MDLFESRSEAAQLMRELDWSKNPLGPPDGWPRSLRTIIPIMLASRFAMRVLWGPELIFLYNDGYRPVLGASKHPSAMGSRTRESFAEVWDIVGPLFERVTAGEAVALDDRLLPLDRNGYLEECYFTLSYSPIANDDGTIGGVLGVVSETTARVLAERRLRTLRELSGASAATVMTEACRGIAAALAHNPADIPFALVFVVEPDTGAVRLVDQVGVAPDSPLASGWTFDNTRATVELAPRYGAVHAGAYPEAVARAVVLPLVRPNEFGAIAYLVIGINPRCALDEPHATFFELVAEQATRAIANARFAEERGLLLARERIAEERLRSLFSHAPAAIALFHGPAHVFELANRACCELVGRHDLIGRPARDALPELANQGIWDLFDRVYQTGEPFAGREVPIKLARLGQQLDQGYFDFTIQTMRDADGAIVGLMVFAIEITAQVRARLAEASARTEAERSNLAKDEFLAIVSHELRNPLSAILGWTRMLRSTELPPEKHAQALETIERNALNQSQLIEDLLDVSRIVSGKLKLEVRTLDFVEIVEAAVESARPAIAAKQLRIRTIIDTAHVALMGDAARLQQVVWNLLTNASKFTPKGGSIKIHVTRHDSVLELEVSDTGSGIDPAFLPYVFEAFKQADSTTTRKHGGLGLGLAISKRIVEMHGGTIAAHSDGEGTGATFTLRLPVAPIRASATPPTGAPVKLQRWDRPAELAGLRVLVVDDDEDGREMIGAVLETCGVRVTLADGVPAALAAFDRERPDVLLSDIGMPGEDGYSLIAKIRARPTSAGGMTPAASLTAYAGVEDRKRALHAGFNMHVPKPVDPAELVVVIASLARIARALAQ